MTSVAEEVKTLSLADFLSKNPPAQALSILSAKFHPHFGGDAVEPLQLAIVLALRDGIGQAKAIDSFIDRVAEIPVRGSLRHMEKRPFDHFLTLINRLDLIEGSTERVIVSPSGLLHRRDIGYSITACGKEITSKWLMQFARGADLKRKFRYGHKICSGCLNDYDDNIASPYQRETKQAESDYAEVLSRARAAARKELIKMLRDDNGNHLAESLPLDDSVLGKALTILEEAKNKGYWDVKKSLAQLFPHSSTSNHMNACDNATETFMMSYAKQVEPKLHEVFAKYLAQRLLALGPQHIGSVFLGAKPNLSLIEDALRAYGSFANLPMPSEKVLTEILINPQASTQSVIELIALPRLLSSIWVEGLMPLVRERYPEGQRLDPTLLRAYRLMPGRKPTHTNGTKYLDPQAFASLLNEHLEREQMDATHLAAEVNLSITEIKKILKGKVPTLNSYLTLQAWLPGRENAIKDVGHLY